MARGRKPLPITDQQIVDAAMQHQTFEKAGESLGVSGQMVRSRLMGESCQLLWRKAQREAFSQGRGRLVYAYGSSISVALSILADKENPPATRLRACELVMSHTEKAIELEDIDIRVKALELAQGIVNNA